MAIRAVSVSNILNKKFERLFFEWEWFDAFLQPNKYGVWIIYGSSSNGKSSFTTQLVKYLEELGLRIDYYSPEEGAKDTMQDAAIRASWRKKGSMIKVFEPPLTPDELDKRLEKHKSAHVFVVDTMQKWDITYEAFNHLRWKHKKKLFIVVSHVLSNEKMEGSKARKIHQDTALKIYCQGYRAISKGRYIGSKECFSIWPEMGKEIWIDK